MSSQQTGVQARWPGNRLPITVLLDDPTPCRNPAWYEFPERGNVANVPNRFTAAFVDLIDRTGAAGKFSVIPCPGAQGRIDEGMPGIAAEDLDGFIALVRERIAPRWDISPEMLTHNKALDLATMRPLEEREDVWAAHQNESTLTPYIALGLQILRNVGLEPNGVTSPWAFGKEVEEDYANAMVTALRAVCGVRVGWYFLHIDSESPTVPPRVMRLDPASGTALVSIVTASQHTEAGHYDFAWRTQLGEPPEPDALLTADGKGGRLAELFAHGSPMAFHTHWQSLFSNGSGAGLAGLGVLFDRINSTWGARVRWTSARELALYAAAREATSFDVFDVADIGASVRISAPFACPEFTVVLPMPADKRTLSLDGTALERVADEAPLLGEGSWRRDGHGALVCFPLRDGAVLSWT